MNSTYKWIKNKFKFRRIKAIPGGGGGRPKISLKFSFGFDDAKYSDRTLLLQIVGSDDVDTAVTLSPKAIQRSPFLHRLFPNGMRESEQKNVTLLIEQLEEVSFIDLLEYISSNNLPTTLNALLNLLVIADKYEVVSCMRDCTRSLQNLPMTCELACAYLDLPSTLRTSPIVEPLIDEAKHFLIAKFKDLHKFKDEAINMSLKGIQAVLFSDDLQVDSEYEVYVKVLLEWARKHYPDAGERREILKTHLLHLHRFPFMTPKELAEEVQTCSDIDPELAYKSETLDRKHCLATEEYKSRRTKVKVVALESRLVYLDFTREELKRIFPNSIIWSETFHVGVLQLTFLVSCNLDKTSNIHYFWLALHTSGSSTHTLDYELSLRLKFLEEFQFWCKGSKTLTEPTCTTYLGHAPWTSFIGDDSTYFINDVLHFKVEITIKK